MTDDDHDPGCCLPKLSMLINEFILLAKDCLADTLCLFACLSVISLLLWPVGSGPTITAVSLDRDLASGHVN